MIRRLIVCSIILFFSLAELCIAQEFTVEGIKQRSSDLESKKIEVTKRLLDTISYQEMNNVSVIHAESAKVKQSDLGLEQLHGLFRIRLQESNPRTNPKQ